MSLSIEPEPLSWRLELPQSEKLVALQSVCEGEKAMQPSKLLFQPPDDMLSVDSLYSEPQALEGLEELSLPQPVDFDESAAMGSNAEPIGGSWVGGASQTGDVALSNVPPPQIVDCSLSSELP